MSATDRPPRTGEVEGVDYRFLSTEEFARLRDEGGFLEWFEVYGDLKGTPRAPVEEHVAAGDDVLIEVDVQGALAIRRTLPDAVLVFVRPPSREVQRERLRARDPDADPADLERRLAAADRGGGGGGVLRRRGGQRRRGTGRRRARGFALQPPHLIRGRLILGVPHPLSGALPHHG